MTEHVRVLFSCGCVRMQCRCPGPKRDERLSYPCPQHAAAKDDHRTAEIIVAMDRRPVPTR